MPLALLLSPDDQAVSAITAVLEEMSVTCERPMDGPSAARQLCAQNFDLVLLDCENLPAAQLIFDVCRRGKHGKNPVPIAIVDGYTGLPTAFRLGADLVLTKPVAMDQARSTIRGAVSRVKKEQTAGAMQPAQSEVAAAGDMKVDAAAYVPAPTGRQEENTPAAESSQSSQTLAAAACAEGVSTPETPAHLTAAHGETASTAAIQTGTPVAPETTHLIGEPAHASFPPSDDPVLAGLEAMEAEQGQSSQAGSPAEVPDENESSPPQNPKKNENRNQSRTLVLAAAALVLVCGGVYGAWMTQPEFRSLAQPLISRALTLAGKPTPAQAGSAAAVAVKPDVPPPPVPSTPTPGADAANTSQADNSQPATTQTPADIITVATSPSANAHATATPSTEQTQAAMPAQNVTPQNVTPQNVTPMLAAVVPSKPMDVGKPVATQNKIAQQSSVAAKLASADATPTIVNPEVILSSKGAESRLIHTVKPAYPAAAKAAAEDSTVVLKAVIDDDGNVVGTQLVKGNAALAESAAAAVKQWHYRPYVRDGKTVPFQTIVMLDFSRP